MAKRKKAKAPEKTKSHLPFDESNLKKGELRTLGALRKKLGAEIANEAFGKWLAANNGGYETADPRLVIIADALYGIVESKQLRITREGLGIFIKRGRGRLIVSPLPTEA